mgnify:CR=1 FL=1
MKRFLSFFCLFAVCLTAGAKGWYFQNLLSPEAATKGFNCVLVQPRGYAWGGTPKGLLRFSYNNESKWYYADGREGSLPGDIIYNIGQDGIGRLWIYTDKGMTQYIPETDSFIPLMMKGDDGEEENVIGYCGFLASDGLVYIGGMNELYIYNTKEDRVLRKLPLGIGKNFRIDAICEPYDNGAIGLFNKESGFAIYYLKTGMIELAPSQIGSNHAYLFDSHGRFWRSKYNRGVECYDNMTLVASYNTGNSDLSSDMVTCFMENNGEIWIGTDGGGINILDPDTGKIQHLMRKAEDFNSFPCNSIVEMCLDSSNSVWAIRDDGGAILLREVYMRTIAFAPVSDQFGHSSDEILCLAQSKLHPEVVWIGTASSGLFTYDMYKTDSNVDIRRLPELGKRRIESMLTLPNDELLLFSANDGLYIYNPSTRHLRPFTEIKDQDFYDRLKYSGQKVGLSMDNLGHVLILAVDAYIWDLSTNKVVRHPVPMHEGHDAIYPVSHGQGKYYYCEKYLYFWDAKTYRHEFIFEIDEGNSINSVSMDDSGEFWLATDKGVYVLGEGQKEARKMEFDRVKSAEVVLVDDSERIWIATSNSMFVYLPKLDNLMRFGNNDGVNWNKFNGKSWLHTEDRILFGGVNGMLTVDPSVNFFLTDKPDITIQDLVLNGTRLNAIPPRLVLTSSYKSLEIKLFVRESNILRDKQFRFIIKNGGNSTVIDKDEPELSFAMLPAGVHKVQACCTLQNGSWTEPVDLIQIKVLALWYKAWWFWAMVLLVGITLLYVIIHSYKTDADYKLALAESEAENKAGQDSLKFLLNVSHELKTPLTLIISPLSRLLKNKDKSDPEYNVLNNVLRQANRMSRLILTVLDSHKIQDGSASFNGEVKGLNNWVSEQAAAFEDEAGGRRISLVKKLDPAVGNVMIDSQKLENVITNMMINAFKHSPDNTTITVGTTYQPESKSYRVFVSDEGEGLGGVDMTKLFSRFYQGYAQKSGSGLGLAYANSIVEMHGGQMGAYENAVKGATFYFDLSSSLDKPKPVASKPVAAPQPEVAAVQGPAQMPEVPVTTANTPSAPTAVAPKLAPTPRISRAGATSIGNATLLIVDDDVDLREYLIEEFSAVAAVVLSASNGKKAYEIARNQHVDVVVSDVMMPVMDGFELTDKIKRDPNLCDIPVILLTARVEAKSREHGLSIGADAYLPKPFDKEGLIKAINKLLE